jgi:alanyl-tRNA synthetase
LSGDVAFKLYDTFGFPYDLTEDALRARGIAVDRAGFDAAMAEQRRLARAAWSGSGEAKDAAVWFDIVEAEGATEFTGYSSLTGEAKVVALVKDGKQVDTANAGDKIVVVTNQTPFYAESGGQAGDGGRISWGDGLSARVADTRKALGKLHLHDVTLDQGPLNVGDVVKLYVDAPQRGAHRRAHSATHLLHAALRRRLGTHVTQKGSYVGEDYLRFDFSHQKAVTAVELAAIEADVNAQVLGNRAVSTKLMTPDAAIEAGAMALFGEKYGEEVRVLSMGGNDAGDTYSVELCGGTHVGALGDIGLLKITSESAVASGVRRIEGKTGIAARDFLNEREALLIEAAAAIKARPKKCRRGSPP